MTSPPATALSDELRFIVHLRRLADAKERNESGALAALAALRRGLGKEPGDAPEMYPYVAPYLPADGYSDDDKPYYQVAALFGWHPLDWPREQGSRRATNLGASFRRLSLDEKSRLGLDNEPAAVEKRFVALLNCHADDLRDHLRHAVGLLKAKDVRVDYLRLLLDLRAWDRDDRRVQRDWARAFWGSRATDEGAAVGPGPDDTETKNED